MSTLLVAAAIIEHQGKILLTRRMDHVPYPCYWEFPGGKVEPGEDPRDSVTRELREELGVEVAVDGIFETIYHRYPERDVLILAYRCRWLGGEIRNLEVADHCWSSPALLGDFRLLPADIPLARRISEEFAIEDIARL